MSAAQLMFAFPIDATFEDVSAAIALHFGGAPINLSTGAPEQRDPSAVFTGTALNKEQFTGTASLSVSTGATVETAQPTIELDVNGLPWDERIHSSAKTKNADGSWRGKKGVAPTTLAAVRAELAQRVKAGPAVAGTPSTPSPAQVNLHNNSDEAVNARLSYAHEQAIIQAGPQCISDAEFQALRRGVLITVTPAGNEWFKRYQAAFNDAYAAYANSTLQSTVDTIAQMTAATQQMATTAAPTSMPATESTTQMPSAAAPVTDFPSFCARFGEHLQTPTLTNVLSQLGITGGFAMLATQPAMIPAAVALLAAQGIV